MNINQTTPVSPRGSSSETNSLHGYVLTALFASASAAVGYLLIALPNIEAFTALLFVAGYTLGAMRGIMAAVIASLLYFGLNPQGGLFPPLLAAQMLSVSLSPLAGSLFRATTIKKPDVIYRTGCLLALNAFVVTFIYDLATNLAYPISTGQSIKGVLITLMGGIPFSAVHIIGNILIFIILIPPLINLVKRYRLINAG